MSRWEGTVKATTGYPPSVRRDSPCPLLLLDPVARHRPSPRCLLHIVLMMLMMSMMFFFNLRLAGLTGCKPGMRLGLGLHVGGGGGGAGGTGSSKSGSYLESLK